MNTDQRQSSNNSAKASFGFKKHSKKPFNPGQKKRKNREKAPGKRQTRLKKLNVIYLFRLEEEQNCFFKNNFLVVYLILLELQKNKRKRGKKHEKRRNQDKIQIHKEEQMKAIVYSKD